jgi:haloalkane dehalogenase
VFQERVPGTKGQPHTTIKDAGHFLQEDAPDELVAHIHAMITNAKAAA